ncbi:hypothetical protein COCCADRAFT_91590, partial [Bipolaris zeicola 26-R-13]
TVTTTTTTTKNTLFANLIFSFSFLCSYQKKLAHTWIKGSFLPKNPQKFVTVQKINYQKRRQTIHNPCFHKKRREGEKRRERQ